MSEDSQLKVLIVEDEATSRARLKGTLKRAGYLVVSACDGAEGVAAFAREAPDAVFMDVEMPVMDGYEATKQIKELAGNRFVPVIFLTATTDEERLARCVACGGDDFLSKPVSRVILEAKLRAQLRIRNLAMTVTTQRDELALYQIQNEQDIRIAEKIFANMVNRDCGDTPNVKRLVSPASVLNGDVLLVAKTPTGEARILLGDFTGHGLTAAIGTPVICEAFFSMTDQGYSLNEVASSLNSQLCRVLPTGIFFACCMLEIDSNEERVSAWCGGIPEVLVRKAEGGIRHKIPSEHLALGVIEGMPEAGASSYPLEVGDRILAFSDGIIEAENPDGEMFGMQRLIDAFAEDPDPSTVFERIESSAGSFAAGKQQTDDITMVEIYFDGIVPTVEALAKSEDKSIRTAATWDVQIELNADTLRDLDPLPLLIQIPMEIQGLTQHRERLFTVLAELYRNSLDHGILGLDSKLKQCPEGFGEYYSLREERLAQLVDASIYVRFRHSPTDEGGRLLITVEDSGKGFDYRKQLEKRSDIRAKSGRGLQLIQAICDEVSYRGDGNCVDASYLWERTENAG